MIYDETQIRDAIALLEKFLADQTAFVQRAKVALESYIVGEQMLVLKDECADFTVANGDFSVRAYNALITAGFYKAIDLINFCNLNGISKLGRMRFIGEKSYKEILIWLSKICDGDRNFLQEARYKP